MGMFFNSMRKPRGFNHQYIYVDERKEKLAKICLLYTSDAADD